MEQACSCKIIFCTANLPFARYIHWFAGGYAHAALVLPNGNWLDARFVGGVKERPPEVNLYEYEVVELPFDIEPELRSLIGKKYDFKGIIAQWLHFRWTSPTRYFCNKAILAALLLHGRSVVDEGRESRTNPQGTCDIIKAYLRGLNETRTSEKGSSA